MRYLLPETADIILENIEYLKLFHALNAYGREDAEEAGLVTYEMDETAHRLYVIDHFAGVDKDGNTIPPETKRLCGFKWDFKYSYGLWELALSGERNDTDNPTIVVTVLDERDKDIRRDERQTTIRKMRRTLISLFENDEG